MDNNKSRNIFTTFLMTVCYGIWSVVGVVLLALVAIAVFGDGTWVENLDIASQPEVAQQQPAQASEQQAPTPQQPPQPTEEQLACVSEQVGQERFAELQQGAQANEEESAVIQQCLQG